MLQILSDLVTPGLVILIGSGGFTLVLKQFDSVNKRIDDIKDSLNGRIDDVKDSVDRHRTETRDENKANGRRLTQLADEVHDANTWQASHKAEHFTRGL